MIHNRQHIVRCHTDPLRSCAIAFAPNVVEDPGSPNANVNIMNIKENIRIQRSQICFIIEMVGNQVLKLDAVRRSKEMAGTATAEGARVGAAATSAGVSNLSMNQTLEGHDGSVVRNPTASSKPSVTNPPEHLPKSVSVDSC